mgnify:CR=1 FL=1
MLCRTCHPHIRRASLGTLQRQRCGQDHLPRPTHTGQRHILDRRSRMDQPDSGPPRWARRHGRTLRIIRPGNDITHSDVLAQIQEFCFGRELPSLCHHTRHNSIRGHLRRLGIGLEHYSVPTDLTPGSQRAISTHESPQRSVQKANAASERTWSSTKLTLKPLRLCRF